MKKIKSYIVLSIALSALTTGCKDSFLDKTPEGNYTTETFYASDEALYKGVEPLYNKAWFDFNARAIIGMGSYRANDAWNPYVNAEFARFQVTSLTTEVSNAWSSLYNVVTLSNQIRENIEAYCTDDVSETVKNQCLGECYLMRGTAYFYLLRGWGPNILFENNQDIIDNPVRKPNPEEDVLKFVIRDFRKAKELMQDKIVDNHPSRYAAMGMLAKALLAQSGWNKSTRDESTLEEVKLLCDSVINSGLYGLMDNYEDLFKAQNNDNEETLFAMRWADANLGTSSGWGCVNAQYSDLAFSEVTDVEVWGGSLHASVDMIDYYNEEPTDTFRIRGTFFTPGRYYDYIKVAEGGYTYNVQWIQNKKGVLGTKADAGGHLAKMASPLNTYIQRLADIYLIKAEAVLGNNSVCAEPEGLNAINAVRNRARVAPLSSYTFETLIRERRIEFCMEFCNWFDMVSWYRWKPSYMLNFFNNKQHRAFEMRSGDVYMNDDGTISYRAYLNNGTNPWYFTDSEGHCYWNDHLTQSVDDNTVVQTKEQGYTYNVDSIVRSKTDLAPIVLSEANIFMPYPESDVLQNSYLSSKTNTEPYDFTW